MITQEGAQSRALDRIRGLVTPGIRPVILEEHTKSGDFGWMFFYQSAKFLESQRFEERLWGNMPIIVDRRDGSVHETGTELEPEEYIEQYRKQRGYAS